MDIWLFRSHYLQQVPLQLEVNFRLFKVQCFDWQPVYIVSIVTFKECYMFCCCFVYNITQTIRREYVTSWLLDHAWFSHLLATHWLCIVIILMVVQITVEREPVTKATIDSDVRLRRRIRMKRGILQAFLVNRIMNT